MTYKNMLEEVDVEEDVSIDEELSDIGVGDHAHLVVYNDDHNTFNNI